MISTVASVSHALPTVTQTVSHGGWTATGLITAVSSVLGSGGIFYAIVRIAPAWRELGIGARRDELTRINARLDKVEEENKKLRECVSKSEHEANDMRVKMVEQAAHAESVVNELRSIITVQSNALQLTTGELALLNPDSNALRLAREMVAIAAQKDMGLGQFHDKLAQLPGMQREKK